MKIDTGILSLLAFLALLTVTACGDDSPCGGKQQPFNEVQSGTYSLATMSGYLPQGVPDDGTMTIDRESGRVVLSYRTREGSEVVETYELRPYPEPVEPLEDPIRLE